MNNNLYAIQVGNNTYIDWCDNNWYGVESAPLYKFTKEEVLTIIKQLQSHFKYKVIVTNQNNEQLFFEFGKEVQKQPTFKQIQYVSIADDDDEIIVPVNKNKEEEIFEMDW